MWKFKKTNKKTVKRLVNYEVRRARNKIEQQLLCKSSMQGLIVEGITCSESALRLKHWFQCFWGVVTNPVCIKQCNANILHTLQLHHRSTPKFIFNPLPFLQVYTLWFAWPSWWSAWQRLCWLCVSCTSRTCRPLCPTGWSMWCWKELRSSSASTRSTTSAPDCPPRPPTWTTTRTTATALVRYISGFVVYSGFKSHLMWQQLISWHLMNVVGQKKGSFSLFIPTLMKSYKMYPYLCPILQPSAPTTTPVR